MARDVNWWLMSLSFLLGLLLTLALTIRKVTREVPVNRTVEVPKPHLDKVAGAVAVTGAGAAAKLHDAAEKIETKVQHVKADVEHRVEHVEHKNTDVFENAEHVLEREPYGAGSIRVTARTAAPAGYTIKGDKDTGKYFTLDSPEYEAIEAEVWFANDESAEKAGFVRWNATDVRPVGLLSAESATVVTEGHQVAAETVITEEYSSADSSLVIVDDGIPETTIVVVDDGIPDTESRIRIIGTD
jgi:ElaB/YqjD/DUF883 family membrane-anchored ribosome-binding protein